MDLQTFLRRLPKIELHNHLEGAVRASTFVELAIKHNIPLPPYEKPEDLYNYRTLSDFLQLYNLVASAMQDYEDFHRVTYEALADGAANGLRYIEMFWSPMVHLDAGVSYVTAVDGILAGARDAETDSGVQCRLIPAINREEPPQKGLAMVKTVLEHRREAVIGIGLDYDERPVELFVEAFQLAASQGLHLTSHAGEGGPPSYIRDCLDLLQCERIDHGYRILEDESLVQRCSEEGIVFTVAPTTTAWLNAWGDLSTSPIREMVERSLKIVINTDDPGQFGTDLTQEYAAIANMGFEPANFKQFVLNGIDGAWLDDSTKREWRQAWSKEIDDLIAQVE